MTFEDAPQVHQLAAHCQAQLHLPFLDHVPAEGLHLTLHRIGFTDETTPEQVRHILRQARARCADLTAFTIDVGPLAGSSGAIRLTASPTRPIAELRARLHGASATASRGHAGSEEARSFRPHVGIAYCNTPTRTDDLIPLVAALRTLPTAPTSVTAAHLVVLRRHDQAYQWDTLDSIRLHTPAPADLLRPG